MRQKHRPTEEDDAAPQQHEEILERHNLMWRGDVEQSPGKTCAPDCRSRQPGKLQFPAGEPGHQQGHHPKTIGQQQLVAVGREFPQAEQRIASRAERGEMQGPRFAARARQHVINGGVAEQPGGQERWPEEEVQAEVWPQAGPLQHPGHDGVKVVLLTGVEGQEDEQQPQTQHDSVGRPDGLHSDRPTVPRQSHKAQHTEANKQVVRNRGMTPVRPRPCQAPVNLPQVPAQPHQ